MKKFESIIKSSGYAIPYSENFDVLSEPVSFGSHTCANRIAIQPMEGCDGTHDGKIDVLTHRRYMRFAKSGAGIIWFEATSIVNEGRANPRQLFLCRENVDSFKRLIDEIRCVAAKETGVNPIIIMQATHSGRYSKPDGVPAPLIAYNKPIFEKSGAISADRILSDDYLEGLEEKYGEATILAKQAGFDGVDIKCCHGYLMSELMGAHTRPGKYGGSFENRTRLYFNAVKNASDICDKNFFVTSRFNAYDGFEYPYGFGVSEGLGLEPVFDEPIEVLRTLHEKFGMKIIDITAGNPYVNPHVNRPYNVGPYVPPENPMAGVERMCRCVKAMKEACPGMTVIGSAFSFMADEGANLAAGCIKEGVCDIAGFGRQAFAYPEFYKDIVEKGLMDKSKCCIACGKCSELMRAVQVAGCVIRDSEVYLPIYSKAKYK